MSATSVLLTEEQTAKASSYLAETRDHLLKMCSALTCQQWSFKPATGGWSIGEIVEHLILIERRVQSLVQNMETAPTPAADWTPDEMDQLIPQRVPDRSNRVASPPFVIPTNCWRHEDLLNYFSEGRKNSVELLSTAVLRGHVMPHPIFGAWDGYQWLLATAAHTARHIEQIREVKSAEDFPQA